MKRIVPALALLCLPLLILPSVAGAALLEHPGPLLRLRAGTFDPAAPRAFSLSLSAPTAYQIVQCNGAILPQWRTALEQAGLRVYDYIPDDAFVCRIPLDSATALSSLPFVRAVTPYLPEFKIAPEFSKVSGTVAANVSLFPDVDPSVFAAAARTHGLTAKVVGTLVAVAGDAGLVRSLARQDGVRWIEALPRTRLFNMESRVIMNVNQVWHDFGIYGDGQIVADFDTGLDLGSNQTMSADFAGKVVDAMVTNPANLDNDWSDRVGHGTLTAGIMAGRGALSGADPTTHRYIRSYAGVAPEAKLLIQQFDYDVCTDKSPGFDYQTDLKPILDWAYQRGARIHNDSWGDDNTSFGAYSLHSEQIDQFVWDHPDFSMFVAGGNSGKDGLSEQDFLNELGMNACQLASLSNTATSGDLTGLLGSLGGGDLSGLLGGGNPNDPTSVLGGLLNGDGSSGLDAIGNGTTGSTGGSGASGSTGASGGTTGGGASSGGASAGTGSGTSGTSASDLLGLLDKYNQAMQDAQAQAKGKVEPGSLTSPGTAKNIVTVGASEGYEPDQANTYMSAGFFGEPIASDKMSDNMDGMAAFSSRGPTLDGRIKPDLVAPGTNIISNRSALGQDIIYWAPLNANYAYSGGTSLASPFVAGSAALVREWLQKKQNDASPSAALIKALLINGAHDMAPGQYGTDPRYQEEGPRPNPVEGWGRVDLAASLDPTSPRSTLFSEQTTGLDTGASKQFRYRVAAGTPFKATLAWTDYPASPTAAKDLVNDLDLTVTGPDGVALPGNGAPDHVNNVEGVDVASPAAGDYVVQVKGADVPHGPQPYALVISGAATAAASGGQSLLPGDLDGDGRITITDVTLALQAAVGTRTLTADQIAAADVAPRGHPDGTVDIADATLILEASIGLIHL